MGREANGTALMPLCFRALFAPCGVSDAVSMYINTLSGQCRVTGSAARSQETSGLHRQVCASVH